MTAFISYAFNLNLGTLIGGIASRFRLYTKFGLSKDVITRVLGLSLLTNWLGYFTLGGAVLCFFTPRLPAQWHVQAALLPWLGGGLLAVAGAYLLACTFSKRREWNWCSHTITLPTARMALLQLALSMLNWMIIASVVFTLLQARIAYPTVLVVLLIAAVAGIISRVSAGLGVLEAVFVAMRHRDCQQRNCWPACWPTARCTTCCRWRWRRCCSRALNGGRARWHADWPQQIALLDVRQGAGEVK